MTKALRTGLSDSTKLFLTGDVMTGRGIDQVLPHPCNPRLHEPYVKSACDYVALAERAHGRIATPLAFDDVWGDALAELAREKPDLRLINLETAITASSGPARKDIHYRMHPENAGVLSAAGIDACVLANNHTLDWGEAGLLETLYTLRGIGIRAAGAGRNLSEARAPAAFSVEGGRVLLFAFGSPTSGVPHSWAAGKGRPGISFLPDLTQHSLNDIAAYIQTEKRRGDVAVISLHWGPNWGYDIPREQSEFAHGLIEEAGADLVWGHSAHHPKAIEVHRGKLILYGCGDFLDDYEGITGYEGFRGDLALMYFPRISLSDGTLQRLDMVPLRICNFRLRYASAADAEWLCGTLNREGKKTGTGVEKTEENRFVLRWGEGGQEPGGPACGE